MPSKSKKDFIENLINFHISTGKVPTYSSYKKYPELIFPGSEFAKKFGKFSIAMKEAGFDPFYDDDGLVNSKRKPLKEVKFCLECNNEILSKFAKKFCSSSCSTSFNNKKKSNFNKLGVCLVCKNNFIKRTKKHNYCSIDCRNFKEREKSYLLFKEGKIGTNKTLRIHLSNLHGYKCAEISCGISDWHNKNITLEVDHIDGNPDNNLPNNLRLLCPNCHSQTPTFRIRNFGKPKSDRRSKARRKRYNAE